MTAALSFDVLAQLAAGRAKADAPCPICGPARRELRNRLRPVLRIWVSGDFASYCCARCQATGHARAEGPAVHRLPTPKRQVEEADAARTAKAVAIWNEAADPHGSLAEQYLQSRGLELADLGGRVIRFHPRSPWEDRREPCMITAFRHIHTDTITGIQRTRLPHSGPGPERRMMGPVKDAVIKIDDDADVTLGLHLGEGFESCLSARQLGLRPVWAAGSAGAIRTFPMLSGVEALTLLSEPDQPNSEAIEACAERWAEAGREVRITRQSGGDMNGFLQGREP